MVSFIFFQNLPSPITEPIYVVNTGIKSDDETEVLGLNQPIPSALSLRSIGGRVRGKNESLAEATLREVARLSIPDISTDNH